MRSNDRRLVRWRRAGGDAPLPLLPEPWPELQSAMAEKPATAMALLSLKRG